MAEPVKLTIAKCQALCSDFSYSQQKKSCIRLRSDKEMCDLPSHFLCELVRWKKNQARKAELGERACSASRLNTIERCPRAYALHYLHHIEPDEGASWKRVGDAWGVARARIDMGLDVDLEALRADLLPYERSRVRAAIRLYRLCCGSPSSPLKYHPGDVTCEDEVLFNHGGLWWLGFADALSKNREHIYEWKFAVTEYDVLSIARQAAVYLSGFPEAKHFTLCVMRKPGQRPGKTETEQAYENRIFGAMCEKPEDWIRCFTISRDQLDVSGVLHQMVAAFLSQEKAAAESGYAPHYSSCRDCDYRPICSEFIGKSTDFLVQAKKVAT